MPTDLERLVVSLEARVDKYTKEVNKAVGTSGSATRQITRQFDDMGRQIERRSSEAARRVNANLQKISAPTRFKGLVQQGAETLASRGPASAQFVGSLFGGASAIAITAATAAVVAYGAAAAKAGDDWLAMGNRLRAAGVASADLADQQNKVVEIATASHADLQATTDLYVKMIGVTKALGISQTQAGVATKAVAQALALGGVSAEASAGAITQLGQALGSGVLRGDEFNSVMEALGQDSPIVQAIAKEFGVTTQQLRGLADAGQLVADRVFRAIVRAAPDIEKKAGGAVVTLSQAFTDLNTAATRALATLGGGADLAANTAEEIKGISNAINGLIDAYQNWQKARGQQAVAADIAKPADIQAQIDATTAQIARYESAIAKLKANPGIDPLGVGRLQPAVDMLKKQLEVMQKQLEVAKGIASARKEEADSIVKATEAESEQSRETARGRAFTAQTSTPTGTPQAIFDQRDKELAASDKEKEIQKATDEIVEALKKAGKTIDIATYDQARAQAEKEYQAKIGIEGSADVLKHFVDRVVGAESGGDPRARNPNSTATGVGQFIESTWLDLFRRYYPQQAATMGRDAILALRNDSEVSRRLIEAYAKENADALQKAGLAVTEANLHLAHFLGVGGAIKVLKAAPDTPVANLLPQSAISANQKILGNGATAASVIAYAQRRAGDTRIAAGDLTPEEKRAKSLADIIKAEQDDTAAINQKSAALTQSVAVSDYAAERTKLLNEATKAGIVLTPDVVAALEKEAQAHAAASQAAENHEKTLKGIRDAEEFVGEGITNMFSDIITGSASAQEALKRLLDTLVQAALQALLLGQGPLAGLFGTAGSGGGMGGILGAIFGAFGFKAEGGEVHGPGTSTSDSIPTMLSDGEHVIKARQARKFRPLLNAINDDRFAGFIRRASGGSVGAPVSFGVPALPSLNSIGSARAQSQQIVVQVVGNKEYDARILSAADRAAAIRDARSALIVNKSFGPRAESYRKLGT